MDQHAKSIITAYKYVKREHKRLFDLIIEFIEDGKADPHLIQRAAAEIGKLGPDDLDGEQTVKNPVNI